MNKKRLKQLLALNLIALVVGISVLSYAAIDNNNLKVKYGDLYTLEKNDTDNVVDIIFDEPHQLHYTRSNTRGITYFESTMYILGEADNYTQRYVAEIELNKGMNLITKQVEHYLPFLNTSNRCVGLGFDGNYFYTLETNIPAYEQFLLTFNLTHGLISNRTLENPPSVYTNVNGVIRIDFDIWENKLCCMEGGELDGYWIAQNITMYNLNTLNWIESFNATSYRRPRSFSVDNSGKAWMYYEKDPLSEISSVQKTRFYSIMRSSLGFSLNNCEHVSSIHISYIPTPYNTSLLPFDNYAYNIYEYDVYWFSPIHYSNRIIYPLYIGTSGSWLLVGFRLCVYNPVKTFQTSELTTIIVSFTVFLGISTYMVHQYIKKKNLKISPLKDSK